MTALSGTPMLFGNLVDHLLASTVTFYMGNLGLQGLSKIAVVARRGVNEVLKWCYFDPSRADTKIGKLAAYIPTPITNFFKDDSGYNAKHTVKIDVPDLDTEGNQTYESDGTTVKMKKIDKEVYVRGPIELLVSGIGLSLIALIALELKETLWRPAHPLLNSVLSYISPFRAVLGQSWVADGVRHLVGAAKARI